MCYNPLILKKHGLGQLILFSSSDSANLQLLIESKHFNQNKHLKWTTVISKRNLPA